MRVSVDCRYIRERPSGIGAYVQALVDRVPALAPADQFHFWVHPRAQRPLSGQPNISETLVHAPANGLRTLVCPTRLADLRAVDVLHAPFNTLGRAVSCATVVTVHDLLWLVAPRLSGGPAWFTPLQAAYFRAGIHRAIRRATRIVAISRATADAIVAQFPEARSRVQVVHHGVEHGRFHPAAEAEDAVQRASELTAAPDGYFLVIGQNAPSKNHQAVLRAFAAASLEPGVRLVLVQRLYRGQGSGLLFGGMSLEQLARKLGIADRVVWLEPRSTAQVTLLMQGALALVQFSRFEGFGMPALEAMACGTPVVASDIAPLTEILGGAGLQVSLSVAALAGALRRLAAEPRLRADLSQRGLERSRDFSWDRSAEQHLEIYREAASLGVRRA